MRRLLHCMFLLTLGACSSSPVIHLYDGPARPLEDVLVVEVPMELEVLTLNERRVEQLGGVFSYGTRTVHLPPGEWRFVAHYQDIFELDADRHDVVKSDPALFTVSGEAGERFRLDFRQPASVEEARQLAARFDGWVKNLDDGERTPSRPAGIVTAGGFLDLLAPVAASSAAASDATASRTTKPVAGTSSATTSSATNSNPRDTTATPDGPAAPDTDALADTSSADATVSLPATADSADETLQRLKALWQDAAPHQRQQFLLWLAE